MGGVPFLVILLANALAIRKYPGAEKTTQEAGIQKHQGQIPLSLYGMTRVFLTSVFWHPFSGIGCYGSEIETPNLDHLAAGGTRFVNFHNNAKAYVTRASLTTGLEHQQPRNFPDPGNVTPTEVLQPADCRTLMSGKWHLASPPSPTRLRSIFRISHRCNYFFTGID